MVLAKLRSRDVLADDQSDARPLQRIALGKSLRVKLLSDKGPMVIETADGREATVAPAELVVLACLTCGHKAYLEYNPGACAYCRSTEVRVSWAAPRLALVPIP